METFLPDGLRVIDTDTHWSEPYDLWTSRAPSAYVDRVPQMAERNGRRRWWFDGDIAIGLPIASSVVAPDGEKITGTAFFDFDNDMVHRASFDPEARVEMMDALGVHAQIMYPNVAGFGNQNFLKSPDDMLRLVSVQIYNDALAEFQDASGQRVFGMALLPWWDLDAAVAEIRRVHGNGLRGIVTCSNPEEAGLPDMAERAWDPVWEVCSELAMPVNFHIGSSKGNLDFYGKAPWPSFGAERKLAVGSANLFMGNARVIGNMIYSGVPERFPELRFVSVESGVRVAAVLPGGARPSAAGDRTERAGGAVAAAVGVLPAPVLRYVLVRTGHGGPGHRLPGAGQRDVRDRLPPPDLPLPPRRRTAGPHPLGPQPRRRAHGHAGQRSAALPHPGLIPPPARSAPWSVTAVS